MEETSIKIIFWDFDGVIMNSNAIRDRGFQEVLKDFPSDQVNQLLAFHQKNGGLSRYVKFRHFFEVIRQEKISEDKLMIWAERFSKIMLNLLINKDLLIDETISFIKNNHKNFKMHIVSGSDQKELRKICHGINIAKYFESIHGSPTPKNDLVAQLLKIHNYQSLECLLIGDSKNDFEAADINNIHFMGYGNKDIKQKTNLQLFL